MGQVRLQLYQTSKKAPLLCEILAMRLPMLTKIYNQCVITGSFSNVLKIAQVISIQKAGTKDICSKLVVPIYVEHRGGIICNFTPILPYFQHWGDEARPRFFSRK